MHISNILHAHYPHKRALHAFTKESYTPKQTYINVRCHTHKSYARITWICHIFYTHTTHFTLPRFIYIYKRALYAFTKESYEPKQTYINVRCHIYTSYAHITSTYVKYSTRTSSTKEPCMYQQKSPTYTFNATNSTCTSSHYIKPYVKYSTRTLSTKEPYIHRQKSPTYTKTASHKHKTLYICFFVCRALLCEAVFLDVGLFCRL